MTNTSMDNTDQTNDAQVEATDQTIGATDQTTESTEPGGRREAKYRRELRATEAERDTLRTQVETLQRAAAEAMSGLARPAALWATGTSVTDLLGDDGHLDPDKVAQAAQGAQEALGARPSGIPRPDPTQGGHGAVAAAADPWSAAFAPSK